MTNQRFLIPTTLLALLSLAGCDNGGGMTNADSGMTADGGGPDAPTPAGETGRMVGMTEAHNRLRAMVPATPALPPLTWSVELAAIAQAYSERLASTGCGLNHSSTMYGENLYWQRGLSPTPADVVQGWYDEVMCYTPGPFMRGDQCDMACTDAMNASGCGHYTQVIWRNTQRVGCGVAVCPSGAEIWTCNYDPPGNYLGQNPY